MLCKKRIKIYWRWISVGLRRVPALRVLPSIFKQRYTNTVPTHTLRICIWASVFVCLGLSICICVFVFRKCFHPSWSQDTAPVPPHCKRHWVSQSGTQYVKCGQSLSDQPTLNACPRYCLRYLNIVKDIRYLENGTQCAQTNLAHMCVCQTSSDISHWKRQFIFYCMMQNFLGTIDIF